MHIIKYTRKQVLPVIAEIFAKDRQSPFIHGFVRYCNPKVDIAFVIKANLVQSNIGDAASINIAALLSDADQLQHPVLIQMRRPPVWIERTPGIAKIAWTRPTANLDAVDVEKNIRRVIIAKPGASEPNSMDNWISLNV